MLKWKKPEEYKYNPEEDSVIKFYDRYDERVEYNFTEAHEINGDHSEWVKDVIEHDDGGWGTDSIFGWVNFTEADIIPIEKETEKAKDVDRLYITKTFGIDWTDESSFDFGNWYMDHSADEELPREAYTEEVGTDVLPYKVKDEYDGSYWVVVVGYIDIM